MRLESDFSLARIFFNTCQFSYSIYHAKMSMSILLQLNPFHFYQKKVSEEE